MRKLTLLTSVLLAVPFYTGNVSAQCMNSINCQTLGYTKTSCTKGGVKCPTGNYWYCPKDTTTPQCSSSYKYTCTGYLQSPSGTACNGLYTSCTCTSGYQWTNGSCQKKEIAWGTCTGLVQNCSIGDILNSDGTCSTNKISGKTPIGVVVYKSGNCGQALALESIGEERWSTTTMDIPGIPNYGLEHYASLDFESCENTEAIYSTIQHAIRNIASVVKGYVPSGIPQTGTKWCVPALGIWKNISENLTAINNAILRAGGKKVDYEQHWSSTESEIGAWTWPFFVEDGKLNEYNVRPVLQF